MLRSHPRSEDRCPEVAAALAGATLVPGGPRGLGRRLLRVPVPGPANRIAFTALSLPQLKILQEAIPLLVFVPFSTFYMRTPVGVA